MSAFLAYFSRHKIATVFTVLVAAGGGYWYYVSHAASATATTYVTAAVEKGTVVASVSGSGQMASTNQVDMKPKVSGEVTQVAVSAGDIVKAGTVLVRIDARDALKAVRDAQANLDSARLSLDKLRQPADDVSRLQANHSFAQAQETKDNAVAALAKSREDGYNAVSDAYLDFADIMTGLQDILYGSTLNNGQASNIDAYADAVKNYDANALAYRDGAAADLAAARSVYDAGFAAYKASSRSSSDAEIEALIADSYTTSKLIAESVKSATNLVQFYKDRLTERGLKPKSVADTHLASLTSYTSKANGQVSSLLGARQSISNAKEAIVNATRSVEEKAASLAKLQAGTDALDLRSQELSVVQRENALRDAQEKLADYALRAPIDGVVAKVSVKKGDTASSGTAAVTVLAARSVATVSLNEVDVAKVKVGQKATLNFDAVEGLQITGVVTEVDSLGSVSQGVVTYVVTIGLDTQDERIKSGMTVSAAIVTDLAMDVLYVPNAALKSQGGAYRVEVLTDGATVPESRTVTVGLASDDATEIKSGLTEGEKVVTRTVTAASAASAAASTQRSLFSVPSGSTRAAGAALGR